MHSKSITPVLLVALAACRTASATAGAVAPEEWTALFDGYDLAGWRQVNCAPDTWTVRDGMIVCNGKPTGVLRTSRMLENFELELEWRHMVSGGNAGIFVASDALPARGQPFTRSTEVQVLDGTESPDYTSHGDVFAIHGASLVPDRPHPSGWMRCLPSERRAKGSPEWNHYRIRMQDGRLELAVNGAVVSGAANVRPRKGYLCLESEGSEVHFRNLRLRELAPSEAPLAPELVAEPDLGWQSLYDGATLAGWKEEPTLAGHWRPSDWRLAYDGAGETLWSARSFRDFQLVADWRWTQPGVPIERPVILPSGDESRNAQGHVVTATVDDAGDSGIYLRGSSKSQVNIWCWPCGSGEVYGYRTDLALAREVRAALVPKEKADAPIGAWNRFVITLRGDRLTVELNARVVIDGAQLPGLAEEGPIALQHHGSPIEFANLYVREL
jgi:hypothetical protein